MTKQITINSCNVCPYQHVDTTSMNHEPNECRHYMIMIGGGVGRKLPSGYDGVDIPEWCELEDKE